LNHTLLECNTRECPLKQALLHAKRGGVVALQRPGFFPSMPSCRALVREPCKRGRMLTVLC